MLNDKSRETGLINHKDTQCHPGPCTVLMKMLTPSPGLLHLIITTFI